MRPLRVLHFRQSERMWGPDQQIAQLAAHLPQFGVNIELILMRRWGVGETPHPLIQNLHDQGHDAIEVSARPQQLMGVMKLLGERLRACDLLHTHEFKGDILGMPAARQRKTPWVATDHHLATEDDLLLRAFGYADRWFLTKATAVVVPSRAQANRLAAHIPRQDIHVIHHGIDVNAFVRAAGRERLVLRRAHGVAESQPVIAMIGRLEPVKGHREFLIAAQKLLAARPDLHFWVVGEGRLKSSLEQQVHELGIERAVQFFGYQRDVAPIMAASDLILLPSHHESFGIVLIEAMSLAKPIVATAAGGIPEIVLDGAHGYLIPPGDSELLITRILQVLSHPEHAVNLGRAGQARVQQAFSVEIMAERMADLYRQVCNQGQSRSSVLDPDLPAVSSTASLRTQ